MPPPPDTPVLIGIRTGVHSTFDRIVLDFSGPQPRVSSRFVDELTRDGSGNIEWVTGAAFAQVRDARAGAWQRRSPQLSRAAEANMIYSCFGRAG